MGLPRHSGRARGVGPEAQHALARRKPQPGSRVCIVPNAGGPGVLTAEDEEQKRLAEGSRKRLARSGRFNGPIVTEIVPATAFYPAEEYHQDYYKKNPLRYNYYRWGSGRDQFLDRVWGKEQGKQ